MEVLARPSDKESHAIIKPSRRKNFKASYRRCLATGGRSEFTYSKYIPLGGGGWRWKRTRGRTVDLLALVGIVLACIRAVEELSIEQLHPDHSEDELKEKVNNENIEHVL